MTLLSIENVSKMFGGNHALRNVSLSVERGQFVSLLGPSGCGKTTLLRMIAGFINVSSGIIRIDGEDITRLPPHRRPLNTVFQNYALFPHMNVLDNVAYGPRRAGASSSEARKRAEEALDLVGLADFGNRYPRQMSGGQQQRVALARAVINRPKLLLLDEPLSALDLQLRKRMQIELKQLQEKLGVAFVFVTHDQEEAMAMSDNIAVMSAGRVEQVGSGTEIYRHPKTRFVAEFIGEANLLPIERDESGGLRVRSTEETNGTSVAVVRPEHVHVSQDSTDVAAGDIKLDGTVDTITGVGGVTNIYIRTFGRLVTVRKLGMDSSGLTPEQPVVLSIKPEDIHFIEDVKT